MLSSFPSHLPASTVSHTPHNGQPAHEDEANGQQYHPTAEKLSKVRKHRHRRSGSHGGSGTFGASPRNSPHGDRRRVSCHGTPRLSNHSSPRLDPSSLRREDDANSNTIARFADSSTSEDDLQQHPAHRRSSNNNNNNGGGGSHLTSPRFVIDPDDDDDYLETLDRKVSEIMNRGRQPVTSTSLIPAAGMQASSSTPASFLQVQSQNQNGNISAASASAPLFHNRSPGMAKRIGHDQIQTGSGGNGGGEGLVRFDDEDGGGESTDSDLEDEHVVEAANSNGEEDDLDSDLDNPRFMLRRRR